MKEVATDSISLQSLENKLMHHNYLEIFLFLVFVIIIAKTAGWASTKIGQPAVLGEILAGLLLGPTLIGIAALPIFPESSSEIRQFHEQRMAIEEIARAHEANGEVTSPEEVTETIIGQSSEAIKEIPELRNDPSGESPEVIASLAESSLRGVLEDRKSFLESVIKFLAEIGVLFLMFMAGIETDLAMMKRVGKVAFWAAVGGVILPFLMGFGITMLLRPIEEHLLYTAIFAGTILCATSVSISAQTLKELGALKSKEGTTILGAAVIDDVIGIIVLSLVIAFNPVRGEAGISNFPKLYETLSTWVANGTGLSGPSTGIAGIVILIITMVLFFFAAWASGTKYFDKILTWSERLPVSEPKLAFAIGLGLLFAWSAEYIGAVAAITGTYLAGVLIGTTPHKHEVESKLGILTYSFFVPIFFINIGLEANARTLGGGMLTYTILICVVAIVGKIIGAWIGAKLSGFTFLESLRVGVGMISRGEVGLIVASVGLSASIISKDIFSVMIVMVLVTTLVTPVLLRFLFPHHPAAGKHSGHSSDNPEILPADQILS
jgi:Kef-type K+ transport system membrane component KefB